MQVCSHFRRIPQEGAANDELIQMADAILIKLLRDGLKILGCPMGTDTFCANTLARTALKIEADLQALAVFPHLHQRIKMATFCTNTLPIITAAHVFPTSCKTSHVCANHERIQVMQRAPGRRSM